MRSFSAAHLTALDLAPPAFIEASARAGFDAVGLRLIQVTPTTPGYALDRDPALMRATKAALRATGLRVHDIEFVRITPGIDLDALSPFLDAGAELGAAQVITAPYDPDLSRLADTLADFTARAALRSIPLGCPLPISATRWSTRPIPRRTCWPPPGPSVCRRARGRSTLPLSSPPCRRTCRWGWRCRWPPSLRRRGRRRCSPGSAPRRARCWRAFTRRRSPAPAFHGTRRVPRPDPCRPDGRERRRSRHRGAPGGRGCGSRARSAA